MKQLAACVWIVVLCLGLLVYSMIDAPAEQVPSTQITTAPDTEPSSEPTTVPPTDGTTEPSEEEPTEPSTQGPSEPEPTEPEPVVQVRVYYPDPALEEVWQKIGGAFHQKTGIEVILVDEPGEATLSFLTADQIDPLSCADLSDSAAYAQLISWDLALSQGDLVYGVPARVNCFGLLCNESLMAQAAHTRKDITDFQSLTLVVQNISNAGLHPFAGREYLGHFAATLASLPGDIRPLMDLWIGAYCGQGETDALHRFSNGETVFYLGSTDEYEEMSAIGAQNLGILPLYLGSEGEQSQSLCVAATAYWCVSSQASSLEIQAAKDFLGSLVVAEGDAPPLVDQLELLSPYRQAAYVSNPLEQVFREDVRNGKTPMVCKNLVVAPEGLPEALQAYTTDPTDENWAAVLACLV